MGMVNATRKLHVTVALALLFGLSACATDEIAGIGPTEATTAKSVDASSAHWNFSGTYFDRATNTFYYRINALRRNESFVLTVTAAVTASYDCDGGGIYLADAFQEAPETISVTRLIRGDTRGDNEGSMQLDVTAGTTLSCDTGLQATNASISSVGVVRVTADPASRYLYPLTF